MREAAAGAAWILQITNDAWFGPHAGPRQHFAQARARAAELGLPLARVANTGVTAITDARGRILGTLETGRPGALEMSLPPRLPESTVYARYGDATFWALVLAGAAGAWTRRRRRRPQA